MFVYFLQHYVKNLSIYLVEYGLARVEYLKPQMRAQTVPSCNSLKPPNIFELLRKFTDHAALCDPALNNFGIYQNAGSKEIVIIKK